MVRPLTAGGALGSTTFYLDTDWWRGPHVSMCFSASRETVAELRTGGLVERAENLLAALDPGPEVVPELHYALHERLGRYERRPMPLTPWLPDGSAGLRPLAPRERDGVDDGLDRTIKACHLAMKDLECALFRDIAAGRLRVETYAMDLLAGVATWFTDSDLRATYPSFASHAEAYLATDSAHGTRDRWDRAYELHRPTLTGLLESRIQQSTSGALPAATRAAIDVLGSVVDDTDPLAVFGGSALPEPEAMFRKSDFHTELAENHQWQDEVRDSVWFARYRLVLNLAYLHLTKLGLTPHHRFYTCYLLTRAAQDVTRTTATDVVKGLDRA
ncbi:lantibiotic dehydratase C-terminal domain-containing protein [Isoptericola halotolerans]|uniref:lantibiotic dehydratase C-terminal domain-containing protein n=1 Tax=Isoptericola halotolerans TaxID=300560 RepID=UPI00388ECD51